MGIKNLKILMAFSLAEVLITIGIIGVVAAMTMPSLIQKHQDKELVTRTQKAFSSFSNALLLLQNDYGTEGDNSLTFAEGASNEQIAQNFSKFFEGSKVCKNKNQAGCSEYYDYAIKYSNAQYDKGGNVKFLQLDKPSLILPNGIVFFIISNHSSCETRTYTAVDDDGNQESYESSICANIAIDVNGPRKPNQFGRDCYWAWVYRDRLDPNFSDIYGGKSLKNILSGNGKLEYSDYNKNSKK